MKKLLTLLFISITTMVSGQNYSLSGQVFDEKTKEPLPFVNVTINGSQFGLSSDVDGKFTITHNQPITELTFSFIGYEKKSVSIGADSPSKLKVYLTESENLLREISLVAGENPAFKILRKAIANKKKNQPEYLDSYSYKSYNKLVATIKADSMPPLFDTNLVVTTDTSYTTVDSSGYNLKKFMDSQHLFIMESVTENKYVKPGAKEEKVLATRTSGLKQPIFVLVSSQIQSFSFYDDFISILGKDFLNPLNKQAFKHYVYEIKDTIFNGNDSVFSIQYYPRKNPKIPCLEGVMYINSDGYALQNVTAEPSEKTGIGINIQQKYERFEGQWFPVQLNYDFRVYGLSVNDVQPIGIGRTYIKEVQINPTLNKREFSSADILLSDSSLTKDQAYWNRLRGDSLDKKELRTYEFIDSIGEEVDLDGQIEKLQTLLEGRIPYKFVEFPIDKILRYNIYEGLRLGVGVETNDKLIKGVRLKGYVGYGFRDEVFKYGYGTEITLNRRYNWILGGSYYFDIEETGKTFNTLTGRKGLLSNDTRYLWIEQFDEVSSVSFYTKTDLSPHLKAIFQANRDNHWVNGNYAYRSVSDDDVLTDRNGFNFAFARASFKYSPGDEIMETPLGRQVINTGSFHYYLDVEQGFKWEDQGDFDYTKLNASVEYTLKTIRFGESKFILNGGMVSAEVPVSKLYYPGANVPSNRYYSMTTSSVGTFEAMRNNEFLANKYVSLNYRQNFLQRWGKPWGYEWDLEWVVGAYFGWLDNPDFHQNISTQTASQGYYETGLELNKLFNGMGIGVYRRFGAYSFNNEIDNWAFKLTFRNNFF